MPGDRPISSLRPGRTFRPWVGAAVLAAVAAWVYWPALRGGWIWDDEAEVARNRVLADPGGLAAIWTGRAGPDYFPLKTTAQWLEWRLWGGAPEGYHAVSLGLHLVSALLLWRVVSRLGAGPFGGWLAGLFLVVHPGAVESVAWISEFKNALSLPLLLLAFASWERAGAPAGPAPRGRVAARLPSLAWFLLALLAKASVVMFPLILLLHAWWRRGRVGRGDFRAVLPFLALSLVLGSVTLWFQVHRAIGAADPHLGGAAARAAGAGVAAVLYLSRAAFPALPAPVYPRWALEPLSFAPFLPGLAAAAALAWLAARAPRSAPARHALFGLGFFLLNLVPVLGLAPMAYLAISRTADHLAYLSLAGFCGLLGAAASPLARAGPAARRWGAGLCLAAAALLAVESRAYAGIFRDGLAFWTGALERNPRSWTAENNLGKVLVEQGRRAEAEAHFAAALRLDPGDAEAHYNLALILAGTGRLAGAEAHDREALRLRPEFTEARRGLGNALLQEGRPWEAAVELQAALRRRPGYAEAHADLGVAWAGLGRLPEAVAELREAVRLDPASADACYNLGVALAASGRPSEAADSYRQALRLRPDHAGARRNLGALEGH